MKKILVFLVDRFEETEAIFPIDLMRRASIKVDIVTLTDNLEILSSHNIKIKADKLLKDLDIDEYDAIMLPGGPGYIEYEKNQNLKNLILKYNNEKKLIAAICAAPLFLAKSGILNNKRATVFKGLEKEFLNNNVIHENLSLVVDENIITARSVAAACDFGLEIIEYLLGKEKRLDIEKEIIKY